MTWVDINKGDALEPNYRSRLVAREINTQEKPGWFAATPPGETLRLMLSRYVSSRHNKLMYADVSRAYFYAPSVRAVNVRLPAEDQGPEDAGMVGRSQMSMYGTLGAAANWAAEYSSTLIAAGYKRGIAGPCVFYNKATDTAAMVHCDDFIGVDRPDELKKLRKDLEDKYWLKVETTGRDPDDVQELRTLNKVVRLTEEGVELEADPRHAELVIRELGLEGSKGCTAPGVKGNEAEDIDAAGVEMNKEDARRYRAIVARLNDLSPDRVDNGFAVKEAARNVAKP